MVARDGNGRRGSEEQTALQLKSRRTLERMFRVQRECMYPKAVKDVSQVKAAIMQWEEKWKKMMTELG